MLEADRYRNRDWSSSYNRNKVPSWIGLWECYSLWDAMVEYSIHAELYNNNSSEKCRRFWISDLVVFVILVGCEWFPRFVPRIRQISRSHFWNCLAYWIVLLIVLLIPQISCLRPDLMRQCSSPSKNIKPLTILFQGPIWFGILSLPVSLPTCLITCSASFLT